MTGRKLSLWAALFININIMFGTGIFINTVTLAKLTGFLGFFSYSIVALLLLPLILAIAALLKRYPHGGFYTYAAQDISSFAGFLSAWAYFIGKIASAALLIHVFSVMIQTIIPILQPYNPFVLDVAIICLFGCLNLLHMKTGTNIIYLFIVLKLTPILFAILSCLYLFKGWTINPATFIFEGIPSTIPLVLYAFTGFEASCSISRSIENAERNAPKAVLYSFAIVVCITIIYQLVMFLTFGAILVQQENFLGVFPNILRTLLPWLPAIANTVTNLLHIALASSALGGAYGILFSNHWNLFILAEKKHIWLATKFARLNQFHIPTLCVLAEIFLCISYLMLLQGNIVQMQQISVLGCTIAYTLSIVGMFYALRKKVAIFTSQWIVYTAIGSCLLLLSATIRNFILYGISSLILFGLLLGFGILMFCRKSKEK